MEIESEGISLMASPLAKVPHGGSAAKNQGHNHPASYVGYRYRVETVQ